MKVDLKQLQRKDLADFWKLAFSDPKAEWTKWNGPYFHDRLPQKQEFIKKKNNRYLKNPFRKVVWVEQQMRGMVFAYYEDAPLNKWLDVGITIYDQSQWRRGIGKQTLKQWITELFIKTKLPHIGLTTWSGNYRMLALAESLNLRKEAEILQVRYWQNQDWNSVKYGILRSEWDELKNQ